MRQLVKPRHNFLLIIVCLIFSFMSYHLTAHIAAASDISFSDHTIDVGLDYLPGPSFGLSWGDFDMDGWIDLYIRNHAREPSLYRNQSFGSFLDITLESGLIVTGDFHGASWADIDNDDDLDLYQAVGSPDAEKDNFLYLNNAGSTIFTDIAWTAGVADSNGRGRTPVWFDFDSDGFLDLLLCNLSGDNSYSSLFRNNGDQTFTDTGKKMGTASGAAIGDFDNDGDFDAIIIRADPMFYRNDGTGAFVNHSNQAGFSELDKVSNIATGDYDNDGDLDVYIVRRNDSNDAYLISNDALQYTIRVKDYSEKGFDIISSSTTLEIDIYNFGTREKENYIFIGADNKNPATVPFILNSNSLDTHGFPNYIPGVDSGTYIWFDVSSNTWHIRHSIAEFRAGLGVIVSSPEDFIDVQPFNVENISTPTKNFLFQNQGNGTFTDVTEETGVGDTHDGQAAVWSDFDNDGDLDLYVVNGGNIVNEFNILYENSGTGSFHDIASTSGSVASTGGIGESAAVADYDNDGLTDIIVLNGYGQAPFSSGPRVLLHNESLGDNNWLKIRLKGNKSNRDGIGASVFLTAGSLGLMRQQTGGMHCFSQNSQILHFGLGKKTVIDQITVRWPSGIIQQILNVKVNQKIILEEPLEEPMVALSLIPDNSIVGRGELFGIKLTATNYTNQNQNFKLFCNLTMPNGNLFPSPPNYLFEPAWVSLSPFESKSVHLSSEVKLFAPLGVYSYNASIGNENDIIDQSYAEITVIP